MGQRLNIEILKNGKVLANSYYHWSAYSNCAVNLAVKIVNNFEYIKKYKVEKYIKNQDLLFAIRLLEETGAGLNDIEKSRKILKDETNNLKLNQCKGRTEGIIGITQEDIEETESWEEGRVSIDIETKTIKFDVFSYYDTKEELIDNWECEGKEIPEINMQFSEIQFIDIFDLKAFIDKLNYEEKYYFYNKENNEYMSLVQ